MFVHTRISSAGTRLRLECRCGEIKGDGALDVASLGKQVERRCSSEVIATVNEYNSLSQNNIVHEEYNYVKYTDPYTQNE